MKLSFSTLGCPKWDMNTIISNAIKYGFDAIDFRLYLGNLNLYELPEFTSNAKTTAQKITDLGLAVSCFSSSVRLFTAREEFSHILKEISSYAKMCRCFGAPFIRVFGGAIGRTSREKAVDIVSANLTQLSHVTNDYNIKLLIETHDDWVDSRNIASVVERVNSAAVGVVWDTHHPYRRAREAPYETWQVLGKWIYYTHWKDSYISPDTHYGYQLCLVGDGDIPLKDILFCLKNNGYDGYLTLEWEKMCSPEIDEPEVAFPGYVSYIRRLMQT